MPTDGNAKPHPKTAQLARGRRKYRRTVASAKDWQRIAAAKLGPCRVCVTPSGNGHDFGKIELHHVVPRSSPWFGDDTADNIVPVHQLCHGLVTGRRGNACANLLTSLTDAEYSYAVAKCGETFFERAYGLRYER